LHRLSSSFILGYHGCDREVGERLIDGEAFSTSRNEYDWLGEGVYFWEANPLRGLEFAREWVSRGKIKNPYVVGAVIELGYCLDLTSSVGVVAVTRAYEDFLAYCQTAGSPVPQNQGGEDKLLRRLDCAVVNHLHKVREIGELQAFDTVKGIFTEGGPIYENSGFYKKTHVQVCVRNLECIKGVFRVPEGHLNPSA
jgi:hypothetical protein